MHLLLKAFGVISQQVITWTNIDSDLFLTYSFTMLFHLQYMQPQTPSVQSNATCRVIYKSPLTHLLLDKMANISQTIFSNAFSWMKFFVFWSKLSVCSQGANWKSSSIGLDNGLAPNKRQAIIWTNADPINWRIYATLGDELTQMFNC